MKVSRRVAWISVATVAFAVLAGAWFMANLERETYEVRTAPGAAAARNAWLAAQRLLERLGWQADTVQEAAVLDNLPERGALVLSNRRQYHLTPARSTALLAWVEQGGYLIADASGVADSDPLLRAFDVRRAPAVAARTPNAGPSDDDEPALERGRTARPQREAPARRSVDIPGYGRVLQMKAADWAPLYSGRVDPVWRVARPVDRRGQGSDEVLEFERGRGRVTLINGLWRFQGGRSLEDEDHAEILVALLATHHVTGPVRILARLDTPSLFRWLGDNAAAALASAGALLLFWLWRIVPRFGVARPAPGGERRSLVQHLRAIGRFLWREKAAGVLLDATRANVRRRLAQRGLAAMDLPLPALSEALAATFGVPAAATTRAFGDVARTPHDFTTMMGVLAELDHRLTNLRMR